MTLKNDDAMRIAIAAIQCRALNEQVLRYRERRTIPPWTLRQQLSDAEYALDAAIVDATVPELRR